MIQISVQSEIKKVLGQLDTFSPRQIPFAISKALNETAKDAQDSVKKNVRATFTLRNSWTEKGIRVNFSNKKTLAAEVYTKDYYMQRQETGATKKNTGGGYRVNSSVTVTTKKGGSYVRQSSPGKIAIPMPNILRTGRGIIRKRDTPEGLGKKAFVIRAKGGNEYLAVRIAKGKRAGVHLYYSLKDSARMKPKLKLKDIVAKVTKRRFVQHLQAAIQFAISTTKGPR